MCFDISASTLIPSIRSDMGSWIQRTSVEGTRVRMYFLSVARLLKVPKSPLPSTLAAISSGPEHLGVRSILALQGERVLLAGIKVFKRI